MIEVKNLVKKYGDHLAVDNLSFTVEKGQILGFLGPNGAGKSTTMNILTGYISATEGTVVINGHDIFDEPEEAKKCIGYLPELPPLYLDMTVKEYLEFVADIKLVKRSEKDKMIKKIMNMAKIADVSERLIKQLSKGYRQRVGLAQAIIGFPDVIILDEPTVGLDPMQIIEIRDLIKDLSKNHTIILSSHILSEISAICDTVMIINKGRLIVSDTPENLSKHIGGSNGLHLQVKGGRENIKAALESISGITKIDLEGKTTGDIVKLSAYCSEENDIREAVFYALSEAKCPILDMRSSSMSLEDIFLELTKSGKASKSTKNATKKIKKVKKDESKENPDQEKFFEDLMNQEEMQEEQVKAAQVVETLDNNEVKTDNREEIKDVSDL